MKPLLFCHFGIPPFEEAYFPSGEGEKGTIWVIGTKLLAFLGIINGIRCGEEGVPREVKI